jgi:flagellar motor switch protein FliN/FliY
MSDQQTAQRIELSEVEENAQDQVAMTQRDYRLVKSVPVSVNVELGEMDVTLEQLFSMKVGEVIALDKEVDQPIHLILDGNRIAAGTLVAVDGCFGIEITDVQG